MTNTNTNEQGRRSVAKTGGVQMRTPAMPDTQSQKRHHNVMS